MKCPMCGSENCCGLACPAQQPVPEPAEAEKRGECACPKQDGVIVGYRDACPVHGSFRAASTPTSRLSAEQCQDYVEYSKYASNSAVQDKVPMTFESWITGRNG